MAFVDDDAVVLINRGNSNAVGRVEDPLYESLHRGDVHGCFRVRPLIVELLNSEDISKTLQAFHAGVFERVRRLFAERRAIDEEEYAPEALRLEQSIDE